MRLVRATTAQPVVTPAAAPPYLELILSGGDVCRPVAPPGSPGAPVPVEPPPNATTTPSTTTVASSTSTTGPRSTTTTTVPATTTTTVAPAPSAATAPGAAYFCASGASVMGQPSTAAAAWTVTINQPGAPTRTLTVATAWS